MGMTWCIICLLHLPVPVWYVFPPPHLHFLLIYARSKCWNNLATPGGVALNFPIAPPTIPREVTAWNRGQCRELRD